MLHPNVDTAIGQIRSIQSRREISLHLVVTGGSGYIGQRFVEIAINAGHEVTCVGRNAPTSLIGNINYINWDFSFPLSRNIFCDKSVDVVVHLGHDWKAGQANVIASQTLLDATRQARIPRFIFASSILARNDAGNQYGRLKKKIEECCDKHGEIIARIGLVYGGPLNATWGKLNKIVKAFRVLPTIGQKHLVYPIHLDDVAAALLQLATSSSQTQKRLMVLAHTSGITFGSFLTDISYILHKKKLILLPFPLSLILMSVKLPLLFRLPPIVDPERILGLAKMHPTALPVDLSHWGLSFRGLRRGLWGEPSSDFHQRLVQEATIMLNYVGGPQTRPSSIKTYCNFVKRSKTPWPILKLPTYLLCAAAFRCFEPVGSSRTSKQKEFKRRLLAAALISRHHSGSSTERQKRCGTLQTIILVLVQTTIEVALLPIRAVLGRFLV